MLGMFALILAACQTSAPPSRPTLPNPVERPDGDRPSRPDPDGLETPAPTPEDTGPGGLVPPHMEGRDLVRIGLLLPFGASSSALRDEARSMLNAAQMALFNTGDERLVLMPKDTGGTVLGARSAANAVIADGATIILGPVLGDAVRAASAPAQRADIPMIAFSTDRSVAGDGVYLLSFLPEADVKRMVEFIAARNRTIEENGIALRRATRRKGDEAIYSLALLRPEHAYGDRVESALFDLSAMAGLSVSDIARYGRDSESMSAPTREIAHVSARNDAIRRWRANGGFGDPGLDPSFGFSLPYQAIFIPENGVKLRSLAPLLPFYDVDPKITQFIGTSLWNDNDFMQEPALFGAWFPSANAQDAEQFTQAYESAFGEKPSRLASLAHDAVLMVPQSAGKHRDDMEIDRNVLERIEGFRGADGLFRFTDDGLIERLLSVFEIRQGEFREIEMAPAQFENEIAAFN